MNDMNEMSERDQELAGRLRGTLERSSRLPDPALDQALAAARARALGQQRHKQPLRPWLWASGMALAAGLAMFVVIPGGSGSHPAGHVQMQPPIPAGTTAAAKPTLEDPEMLEDMDMLQALAAEPAHAGQG